MCNQLLKAGVGSVTHVEAERPAAGGGGGQGRGGTVSLRVVTPPP